MSRAELKKLTMWKESLFRFPENKFLDVVRVYVGVIKTPYNKERLVNDLVSFLYKEEHKNTIINLLSERDILFLCAIQFLENVTHEKLLHFFSGEFSTFYLYDYITNLEERLLIYRYFDERSKQETLAINPLLHEKLQTFLNMSILLPVSEKKFENEAMEKKPMLKASLFSSWYAFIAQFPDVCRADGTFKKKILTVLENVFYGVPTDFLVELNTAFLHLGLFFHDGLNLCINEKKWKAFSLLPIETQQLYICVASFRRFPRDILLKHVQFAKKLKDAVPSKGFIIETLLRLSFILKSNETQLNGEKKTGFFANVLQRSQSSSAEEESFSEKTLIEKMVYFGLLKAIGQDRDGKDILVAEENPLTSQILEEESIKVKRPYISINAGFSVTFLVDVDLETMLPLVSCMNIENYDTVCRFEITRLSCMRSFDKGETNESLLQNFEKAYGNSLSQNLTFSINEWYNTYSSPSLYHGYVLQVALEKSIQIENNAILAPRIKKILAPGIYLFDFETKEEMTLAVEKCSLDFIGLPKNSIKEPEVLPFINIQNKNTMLLDYSLQKPKKTEQGSEILEKLKKELNTLDLPMEQKEGLLERIDRKLIITPKQLVGDTVRIEKMEAGGIDFMGKIQVIEQAIVSSNMIEITSASGVYVGRPLKIEKKDGDASVIVNLEDSKTITFLIGQARKIKRFRQPL